MSPDEPPKKGKGMGDSPPNPNPIPEPTVEYAEATVRRLEAIRPPLSPPGFPKLWLGPNPPKPFPMPPSPAPAVGGPAIPCCPSCDSSRCSIGLWMCQGALGLSVQLIDLLRFSRMSVMLVISPFE